MKLFKILFIELMGCCCCKIEEKNNFDNSAHSSAKDLNERLHFSQGETKIDVINGNLHEIEV